MLQDCYEEYRPSKSVRETQDTISSDINGPAGDICIFSFYLKKEASLSES